MALFLAPGTVDLIQKRLGQELIDVRRSVRRWATMGMPGSSPVLPPIWLNNGSFTRVVPTEFMALSIATF